MNIRIGVEYSEPLPSHVKVNRKVTKALDRSHICGLEFSGAECLTQLPTEILDENIGIIVIPGVKDLPGRREAVAFDSGVETTKLWGLSSKQRPIFLRSPCYAVKATFSDGSAGEKRGTILEITLLEVIRKADEARIQREVVYLGVRPYSEETWKKVPFGIQETVCVATAEAERYRHLTKEGKDFSGLKPGDKVIRWSQGDDARYGRNQLISRPLYAGGRVISVENEVIVTTFSMSGRTYFNKKGICLVNGGEDEETRLI